MTPTSKSPARCAARCDGRNCGGLIGIESIDRPRRRPGRWSAVLGSERLAALIDASRPTQSRPTRRHGCHGFAIGDLASAAFDDEIEVVGGDAEGASGISGNVPALASALTGLEPEGAVSPEGANSGDMWAAVRIDRGQPTCVSVGTAGVRCLCDARVQIGLNLRPVEQRELVQIRKVRCINRSLDRRHPMGSSGRLGESSPGPQRIGRN